MSNDLDTVLSQAITSLRTRVEAWSAHIRQTPFSLPIWQPGLALMRAQLALCEAAVGGSTEQKMAAVRELADEPPVVSSATGSKMGAIDGWVS